MIRARRNRGEVSDTDSLNGRASGKPEEDETTNHSHHGSHTVPIALVRVKASYPTHDALEPLYPWWRFVMIRAPEFEVVRFKVDHLDD